MRSYKLFIDESGIVNPLDTTSSIYVLCGCAVEKDQRIPIKTRADQIKFKYWNRTDIIFHSRDIGKRIGNFSIFKKNKMLYKSFLSDVVHFLKESHFTVFIVVLDKEEAKKQGWNDIKGTRESAHWLFYHYIVWLLGGGNRGKITIESATAEKDRYYLNEFSYFLSPKCTELSIDYKKIKAMLTSISFVTKQNSDIEEQLADLFAYAAKCKYFRLQGKDTYKVGSYEDRVIRILDNKLFKKPRLAKEAKRKLFEVIEPFCVLPRK